jgi:hypothetical protein
VLGVIQPPGGEPRVHRVSAGNDRRGVVADHDPERAAEKLPRRLAPGDHRCQGLGKGQPHEHVPRIARGEDQRVHPAPLPGHRVAQQPQVTEVDLHLGAGLAVSNADRRAGLAEPAPLHAEPVQRPVRHRDAPALQQPADLHHRQARVHLRLDVSVAGLQLLPRQPVPARPGRMHSLGDLADQPVSQLPGPAVAGQARCYRGLHIPPRGLAVHAGLRGHPAQPDARQPCAQHFTDLSHRNLPECQSQPPSRST